MTSTSAAVILQVACFVIAGIWIVLRARVADDKRAFFQKLAFVALAAWISEDTCIRAFGFYTYAPMWVGFIDKVPLAIVCIWPVVVMSAMDGAKSLVKDAKWRPLVVMLLVTADASLIEPIAVASGLWSWHEPGPFAVPIIGILGWGFFAFGAALVVERKAALVPVIAPIVTHVLLVAVWWGALRWLPRGVDELPFVVGAWAASLGLTLAVVVKRVRCVRQDLLLRIPAASFFFVLLALFARDDVYLVLYAVAFAPPYIALTITGTPRVPAASVA